MQAPEEETRARFAARKTAAEREEQRSDRLGNLRLGLALVALVLVLLPLLTRHSATWWMLIPLFFVFLVLGRRHDRVTTELRRFRAAAMYHGRELSRFEEEWRNLADDGSALAPGAVDIAEDDSKATRVAQRATDLDLFGPASLFQLLNRSITLYGRRTLASWLAEPAAPELVRARQPGVRELAAAIDTREALAVAAAGDGETPLRDDRLLDWAEKLEPLPMRGLLRVVGMVQPILLVASGVAVALGAPGGVLVAAIILHLITILATRGPVGERAARISTPDRALSRYADLIGVIEAAPFQSEELLRIRSRLEVEGHSASENIRALRRLVDLLDARLNMFFSLTFGPLLLWDMNLVLRAERWQETVGQRLRGWFEAIGEIEALASLGAFAYARPDYAMPELVPEHGVFRATQLSHPLIDRRRVVANDVALGGPGSVLLLSGSNMSGKSTLLRAIGVNSVLAHAGAPVAAQALALHSSVLVTSIRVTDSLARGASHFYAELQRIKHAIDAARETGGELLYLLDEMLHGTNSRERYIGAASVIRYLSEIGAMGVVTTHDLALAEVEALLPPGKITNKHFGDDVTGGQIHFDYKLREGPVQSTNALRLMKAVGIDIELAAPNAP